MADYKLYAAGKKFKFKGYEQLSEGQKPLFAPGDIVLVAETPSDQKTFDENGVKIQSEDGTLLDTAFDTEIEEFAQSTPATRTRAKAPQATAPAATGKATLAKAKTTAGKKATTAGKGKGKPETKAVTKGKEPVVTVKTEALTAILEETPDVMEAIAGLQDTIEQSFFAIGGLCAMVLHEGLYKKDYPEKGGFARWCEEVMQMGKRKVYTLINLYVKTTAAGLDERELSSLGWTKARALANYMDNKDYTPTQYKADIAFAEKHTREELEKHLEKKYVKATKGGTASSKSGEATEDAEKVAKVTFGKFTLFGEQAETVAAAFKKASEIAESDDPNMALAQIVTDWVSLTDGVETTLEMEVTRLERKFGVRLGIMEDEDETVEGEVEDEIGEDEAAEPEDTGHEEVVAEEVHEEETVAEAMPAKGRKGKKKAA